MTRPTKRDDSATFQFKKRTPKALLSVRKGERIRLRLPDSQGGSATVTAKVGEVIKVSLRTREPELAKLRCAAINSQLERLNRATLDGPRRLSQREVVALAGEWHRGATVRWEDDPGPASVRFPGGYVRDCSCNLSLRAPNLAFDFASAAIGASGPIVRQVFAPFEIAFYQRRV